MPRSLTKALLLTTAALMLGAGLAAGSPAFAKAQREVANRGLEPVKQPVVQRTDYVLDTLPDGYNGLSASEKERVRDWFDAIQLGYGDRIYISGDGARGRGSVSGAITDLVADYGLLVSDRAPATMAQAPAGAVRITVSRTTASVPGCPGWGDRSDTNLLGGLSSDYGCSINGNLAAMIANPEDLVHGRATTYDRQNTVRDRAIKAYRAGPVK